MIIFALLQGLDRPKHPWSIPWLWLKKAATIPAFGSKLNPCCTSRSFQSTIVPRFLHEGVKKLGSHHVDQNIYKPQLLSSECRDTKSTFFNHQNVNLTPKPQHRPKKSIPRHCLAGRIINLKSRYWRGSWIGWTEKKRLVSYQKQHISTISGQILQGLYGYISFCDVPIALWRLCQTQLLPYCLFKRCWCWCWLVDSEHSHEHNILLASIP